MGRRGLYHSLAIIQLEAAAPMVTLTGDDLKAFATPASVLDAVDRDLVGHTNLAAPSGTIHLQSGSVDQTGVRLVYLGAWHYECCSLCS